MSTLPRDAASMQDLVRILPGADPVLIGAGALRYYWSTSRETADLDLVVAVEIEEIDATLAASGWRQRPEVPHRWTSPWNVPVDIIPATPQLLAAGSCSWGVGRTMNLCGLDLARTHAEQHHMAAPVTIRVAPPRVIAFLKIVAYLDRPYEREKDLVDLAWLLENYVDQEDGRRWDDGIDCAQGFDFVPAYLLGIDIAPLLSPAHVAVMDRFMANERAWATIGHKGPSLWRREAEPAATVRAAFREGITTRRP